jgi:2-polyprenyl-3-methyl-5-hydroxy-6-metoxy-1,4-benzoquinol methylase
LWVVLGTAMDASNKVATGLSPDTYSRIYANAGNPPLIDLLDEDCLTVLDVGCGAGDNAALMKAKSPARKVYGVTWSQAEVGLAMRSLEQCWVADIEQELLEEMAQCSFDAIIFSHVLEHLRDPASVLARFTALLRQGGVVLIAVPNVLVWRQRLQFLLGRFEYEKAGIMDDTHLRFFTFFTADQYLLAASSTLSVVYKGATGSVPLWVLRRNLLPKKWCERIDDWGCRNWPNLFGGQVLIKAVKA